MKNSRYGCADFPVIMVRHHYICCVVNTNQTLRNNREMDEQLFRQLLDQQEEIIGRLDRLETKTIQEYLSVEQTAATVGVSTKHVRRAMKRGELPYSNIGTNQRATYRIARHDIQTWMESKRVRHGTVKSARQALVEEFFPNRRRRPVAA